MVDNENSDLKTDIALIKKDISQIEKILGKLDSSIEKITYISKTLAIQERIVESHEKRLDEIDEKLSRHHKEEEEFRRHLQKQFDDLNDANRRYIEEIKTANSAERETRHKEMMASIAALKEDLRNKNKEQDIRLSNLEQWRWWLGGIGVTIVTIGTLAWRTFFG